jgi:hypothetical protein
MVLLDPGSSPGVTGKDVNREDAIDLRREYFSYPYRHERKEQDWIPAFAGMTGKRSKTGFLPLQE